MERQQFRVSQAKGKPDVEYGVEDDKLRLSCWTRLNYYMYQVLARIVDGEG